MSCSMLLSIAVLRWIKNLAALQNWHGRSGRSAAPPVERVYKLACSTAAWRTWVIDDVIFNCIHQMSPVSVARKTRAWPR